MRMIRPSWACKEDDITITSHRNQFAPRNSGLPVDYYRDSWWTRFAHRLCFWIPAVGLLAALIFRW